MQLIKARSDRQHPNPRQQRSGYWAMLVGFVGIVALCSVGTLTAQVTYTVFPAKSVDGDGVVGQPVRHKSGVRVALVVQDSTIEFVVNEIARQAHLRPVYEYGSPVFARRISVRLTDASVADGFAMALKGTGLIASVTPDGETVVLRSQTAVSSAKRAQIASGTIVGRVTDSATGHGLSGAQVKVEGVKNLSTITSDSGSFTLRDVPVGDQVVTVRLFGYRPTQRTVAIIDSSRTTVRISMAAVPTVLSDVVTTATGQQKRIEVGNDVTVLNADSIMKVAPVASLTDMLATRVPGLIVQSTSGVPGAPSRIRLRGPSSVTVSDDPILIVDGIRVNANQSGNTNNNGTVVSGGGSTLKTPVGASSQTVAVSTYAGPSALDQIDPNSIETIEVLKGPSATATYGSDAANGVIVVTTKRGHAGPTKWSLTVNRGRTSLPGEWPEYYHAFFRPNTGGPVREEGVVGNFFSTQITPGDILVSNIGYQALNDSRVSPLGTGSNSDASLTVRGGSGPLSYSVTGTGSTKVGYLHLPSFVATAFQSLHGFPAPNWMTDPTTYMTYGGNSNLSAQLGKSGATLSLTSSLFRSAQQQSGIQNILGDLQFQYVDTTLLLQSGTATTLANKLFPNYYSRTQFNSTTFNNSLTLNNWTPWRWLPPVNATAGMSSSNSANNLLIPRNYVLNNTADTLGYYSETRGTNETQTLVVSTMLLPNRIVSTALGINVNANSQDQFSAQTTGLPVGVSVPTTLLYTNGGPTQASIHTATYGWYVAPRINLNSRFFVNPGFRFDGGSASGNSNQLNLFPKLDMSYVAVNRQGSNSLLGLTLLRPRIAFGVAGVQPSPGEQLRLVRPNQVLPLVSSGTATPSSVVTITGIGNTQLKPERSRELEGGFEAQFGRNQKLSLSLTGYNKTRYDAIMSIPLAPSVAAPQISGGTSVGQTFQQYVNVGTIRNTGIEATVAARLLDTRSVGWTVNTNISHSRNIVAHLNNGLPSIVTGGGNGYDNRVVAGYPLNGFWARPIASYADNNGDGYIGSNEITLRDSAVYLGAPQPNYEMTLSTSLSLLNGRININTSLDYQGGLTQNATSGYAGSTTGVGLLMNNPSTTLAQQAGFVAAALGRSSYGTVQTVNTVRWNTLSINYLVHPSVVRMLHVPSLSLALQGSNLGLRTNYRGKDPNVNAFATGNLTSDSGQLPQPRTWSMRVSIGN